MTNFRIERRDFTDAGVDQLSADGSDFTNWPVVYTLNNATQVYIGESLSVANRMRQHRKNEAKTALQRMHFILDETFNKSVCLDLESFLIRLFAGDGRYQVLNGNGGVTDAAYYDRDRYKESFNEIFEQLKAEGLFQRSIPQIVNSDLFKFSPFKALNHDQTAAVSDILDGLLAALENGLPTTSVVQGDPGTGKTIVAVYLIKLLRDIAESIDGENLDSDSIFSDYFQDGNRDLLQSLRIGLVIPQQSLRASLRTVFKKTPALDQFMVISPFDLGKEDAKFDLLIVDEAHRLSQRANQPSGPQNKKYQDINIALFGKDDLAYTQLDWIQASSTHQILLVDSAQSVRPADLPREILDALLASARNDDSLYRLRSQMRVQGAADYVDYVRKILSESPPTPAPMGDYDFRLFDNLSEMRAEILSRESETQLARLVAGFAWPWNSKNNPAAIDIEIDGCHLRWNQTQKDWVNSPTSVDEVGSIHTIQGYDLNYAGVIIGPDLGFDPIEKRLFVRRESYFDKKGKENNPKLGIVYTDDDLLRYIANIYAVLMTRGIRGTYVYVCDEHLRDYLSKFVPTHHAQVA